MLQTILRWFLYSIFLAQYTDSQIQENQLITNQSSFVKHTNPLKLANASTGHFPVVVFLPNGQFVVIWNSLEQDKESSGIYFQLFDVVSNKTVNDTYTYTPTERIFSSYDFPTILPTSFRTFFSGDKWIITIDSRIFLGMTIFIIGINACMDCLPSLNSRHDQSYINKGKKRERREEIIASMLAYYQKQFLTNSPLIQEEALQRLTKAIEDYYFHHVPLDDDVSIADIIIGDNSYDYFQSKEYKETVDNLSALKNLPDRLLPISQVCRVCINGIAVKSLLRTNTYVKKIKENLECPISYDIMTEAVTTPYGRNYQEKAIKKWVRKHHNDPLTRQPIELSDLKPNYVLRRMAEDYIATYGKKE